MTHALIIDDNLDNIEVLQQFLEIEGLSISKVNKPAQLDQKLNEIEPVDVIFLDLEMPYINGYEIFRNFKSDSRFNNVPIVAYSVHVSEVSVVRQMGFQSFLGKPLNADLFPKQLERILNGEHVWSIP